jgi:hypothetical protein
MLMVTRTAGFAIHCVLVSARDVCEVKADLT